MKLRFLTSGFWFPVSGWRRRGLAALMGICATAALPPFYALPLLIPAFSGLFLLVRNAPTPRQAFLDGWWWGMSYFVSGLYWMCISLYVEPEKFAWLTPFALFGVQSVLAVYVGLVTLALHYLGSGVGGRGSEKPSPIPDPRSLIPAFATLWVAAEYLRAHLFTGFPWNLIGYAWTASDVTLQLASLTGIYGLSWLTVALSTLPAVFPLSKRPWPPVLAGMAILALWLAFGGWRLAEHPTEYTAVTLRIVQANIAQSMKMTQESFIANVRKHVALTRSPGLSHAQIIVWPEAAAPDAAIVSALGPMLPQGAFLLTGAVRYAGNAKHWQAWNSLLAVDGSGKTVARYDKHHLVPFGEFIPLRGILPVENIAGGMGDFTRGSGPETLTVGTLAPFSPLICYEAVFPDEATDGSHKPQWLLNVTNDAWFGRSTGPYQHLQMARTRAVEQGLPLVRAANTGISAVFDPLGRELARLPLGKTGILDHPLPRQTTAFFGNHPLCGFLLTIALGSLALCFPTFLNTRAK